jgi:hypothetical protein
VTQLIGNALPQFLLRSNDNILLRIGLGQAFGKGKGKGKGKGNGNGNFRTPWWPRSGFVGDQAVDIGPQFIGSWDVPASTKGKISRFGFQGVTRDAYNSPLPGMTVKLFLTADDTKVTADILSDPNTGEYTITTPYYAPHWIKVDKTGSPNVQGVSVNNIYPNV